MGVGGEEDGGVSQNDKKFPQNGVFCAGEYGIIRSCMDEVWCATKQEAQRVNPPRGKRMFFVYGEKLLEAGAKLISCAKVTRGWSTWFVPVKNTKRFGYVAKEPFNILIFFKGGRL